MHALIFLGGEAFRLSKPIAADLVIAADRGWENALINGVTPHILVGDMDSITSVPEGVETLRVPAVKDETDAQLAIRVAVERGADGITLAGKLSGRADHTLSVIFMLEAMKSSGVACEIVDGGNHVRLARDETVRVGREHRYFGLLSLGTSVVSVSSCRYPLKDATLLRAMPYAVSNEAEGEGAVVTVSGDALLVIESD